MQHVLLQICNNINILVVLVFLSLLPLNFPILPVHLCSVCFLELESKNGNIVKFLAFSDQLFSETVEGGG